MVHGELRDQAARAREPVAGGERRGLQAAKDAPPERVEDVVVLIGHARACGRRRFVRSGRRTLAGARPAGKRRAAGSGYGLSQYVSFTWSTLSAGSPKSSRASR